MYKTKEVSLVIPCHNEEQGIKEILSTKPAFIDHVVIVDNNSNDTTVETAKKFGATVTHEERMGYGWALSAGISLVKDGVIVTIDGDNTYPVLEVEDLLSFMEMGNYDFVVGYRYPLCHKDSQPVLNQVANSFISWFIRTLFKISLKDSQSGMVAFKRNILDKIMVGNMSMGFGFCQEMKINAFLNHNLRCGEVHISYLPRIGRVKFRSIDGLCNLSSVISLYLKKRRNK